MKRNDYIKYTGDALNERNKEFNIEAYIPSEPLIQAIETARVLNRPLLLRGEPGCGKTRLAEALAFELHKKSNDFLEYYFEWPIKSTTIAQDGLYKFDHLARLHNANSIKDNELKPLESFVEYGPLGQAIKKSSESEKPIIILIDEIDKADIDFPNDLLWELEKKEFEIKELVGKGRKPKKIKTNNSPIVIITSNDEKDLPNAFLRRCVFHYIDFPNVEMLKRILGSQMDDEFDDKIDSTVASFTEIFEKSKSDPNTVKIPSTSEMLDWAKIVYHYTLKEGYDLNEKGELMKEGEIFLRPYQVLLKSQDDQNRAAQLTE